MTASAAGTVGAPSAVRRAAAGAFVRAPERLDRVIARFGLRDPWCRTRVREIAHTFLAGYNAMARTGEPAGVHAALREVPRFFRPFAYEGAAMGFGPWALLSRRPYTAFEPVLGALSPATLYQNYVGLGWWLGMWHRHRPARVQTIAERLDHRYRLIVFEGIGFRRGFLGAGDPGLTRAFARYGEAARHVCHQGYGRSLWFVHMDSPGAAREVIDQLDPAFRGDCYSGLGLGFAFSWLDRVHRFDEVAAAVPGAHLPEFLQGAAFGWEARRLGDRELFDRATTVAPARVGERMRACVAAVHRARDRLTAEGRRDAFYQHWRRLTRNELAA